ncbi:MAG: Fic family protein [Bacteroidota bacterium]
MYIYQIKDWPYFIWDAPRLAGLVSAIRHRQGRLIGRMEGLGFSLKSEAVLETLTLEVIKSNEIEGEILDPDQVRSSIARRLGMNIVGLVPSDRHVEGVVEVMLDATQQFMNPLTEDRLFGWHAALFPGGRSGIQKITIGGWRNLNDEPMQVVSGAMGKEKVHFQAPADKLIPKEMSAFLKWFNSNSEPDPLLKAAIAHLWFVTIHPFEDGNGRLARAIADMQLTRADGIPQRFYSMSAQIRLERKEYYEILEQTQKGTLDISLWLEWFLICLDRALTAAETTLSSVLYKAHFWEMLSKKTINERQRIVINKLLDKFEGKLTTSKWAKIADCSQDTAYRDIQNLMDQDVLIREVGGGRSTNYTLKEIK